ncbi:hypothetical protein AWC38_SpisGene4743 [Stylophora pistillata]|uniref:Uncharacterized protein n=1 Tax=Stylophora pistillata TaxID=50429 RepID=A0A2B4SKQ2_STYPI|nr:hypothetical protein AWC38_SpisGene4743 [Stylophora pistillata]
MFPSHMSVNDLGIFAVVMVFGLLIVLLFMFDLRGSSKGLSIPGEEPSDLEGFIKVWSKGHLALADSIQIAKETADKFAKGGLQEHISLWKSMIAMAIKAISVAGMGCSFMEKKEVDELAAMYDVCWDEMEERLTSPPPGPDSDREKKFQEAYQDAANHGSSPIWGSDFSITLKIVSSLHAHFGGWLAAYMTFPKSLAFVNESI